MGIFGNSSPFDQDVEKATSENNSSEDWALILEICDRAGGGSTAARDCLRAITRRLAHTDPHVQLKAATLLDACVSNCGRHFHLEIASRDFVHEYRRLLSRAQPPVARRLRALLKKWAENEFRGDAQLDLVPSLYLKLRLEGLDFEGPEEKVAPAAASAATAAAAREHDDLARAIELSLRESTVGSSVGSSGASSLYPAVEAASATPAAPAAAAPAPPAPRKVRALYDFEAAEDNELTFLAGEIVWVTDASDPNWWKGTNERGEGLFPANFVTADLSTPAAKTDIRAGKSVQFAVSAGAIPEEEDEPEIDEAALDAALLALHEASPEAAAPGEEDLARHEARALRQAGVVDAALQRADARHARLTQLSAELVDALNLYHHLMREPLKPYGVPGVPQGLSEAFYSVTILFRARLTKLWAELVDALNLYHHLMRELLKSNGEPRVPQVAGVPPGVPGVPGLPPHLQQLHYFPPPGAQHPPPPPPPPGAQPPQPRC